MYTKHTWNRIHTNFKKILKKKNENKGGATTALSQNMFFAGTNSTIPFNSDAAAAAAAAVHMGVPNAIQNAVRTPPTLWQYPSKYNFFFTLILLLIV